MYLVLDIFFLFLLLLAFRKGYYQGITKAWRQVWVLFAILACSWFVRIPVGDNIIALMEYEIPILLGEPIGFLCAHVFFGVIALFVMWRFFPLAEIPPEEIKRRSRVLGGGVQMMKVLVFFIPSFLIGKVGLTIANTIPLSQVGPYTSSCVHAIA